MCGIDASRNRLLGSGLKELGRESCVSVIRIHGVQSPAQDYATHMACAGQVCCK